MQSNPVNADTEWAIESVPIKRIEFTENVRAYFPQGQGKLSVITRFRSTFTLTRGLSYIASFFIYASTFYVRLQGKIIQQWKSTLKRVSVTRGSTL